MVAEPSASSNQGFELVEARGLPLHLACWERFVRWALRRALQKRTWWAVGRFLTECRRIEEEARADQMLEHINQLMQGQRQLAVQLQNLKAENARLRQEHQDGLRQLPDLVQTLTSLVESRGQGASPGLVDNRGIGKPSGFSGDESKFREWSKKFELRSQCMEISYEKPEAVTIEAVSTAFGDDSEEPIDNIAGMREPFDIVSNVASNNGCDCWRKLHKRCDPATGSRKRAILRNVLSPGQAIPDELGSALERWEELVARYERRRGRDGVRERLPEDIRMSALESLLPDDLGKHVRLNQSRFAGYNSLRAEVTQYIEQRAGNLVKDPPVTGGCGGGKGGKGDSKGRKGDMSNVTCYNRGKNGHEADRCWQKTRHGNDSKGTSKGGKGKKGKKGGKKDVNQMDEDWAEEVGAPSGRQYRTASGQIIDDEGLGEIRGVDENNRRARFRARRAAVTKPLASASKMPSDKIGYMDKEGGLIYGEDSVPGRRLRQLVERLKRDHPDEGIGLWQEKEVYNVYFKGDPKTAAAMRSSTSRSPTKPVNTVESELAARARDLAARTPSAPTQKEIDQHEASGHAVFRAWCSACCDGRSYGQPRRLVPRDEEMEVPVVSMDFGHLDRAEAGAVQEGQERRITFVVLHCRKLRCYGATALPDKGTGEFVVRACSDFLDYLGHKRLVLRSDGEEAMLSLKKAIVDKCESKDIILEESPVGDRAADGQVENALKIIKAQVRTILLAAQSRWGKRLPFGYVLALWAIRRAASVINRFRVGADGRTGEELRTGRKWERASVAYGERVKGKRLVADQRKRDLESRFLDGFYIDADRTFSSFRAIPGLGSEGVERKLWLQYLPQLELFHQRSYLSEFRTRALEDSVNLGDQKAIDFLNERARQGASDDGALAPDAKRQMESHRLLRSGARVRPREYVLVRILEMEVVVIGYLLRFRMLLCLRLRAVDMNVGSLEVDSSAPLELQSLAISELFNPGCFAELAPAFGLAPGVAADIELLNEDGEPYDLSLESNQVKFERDVEFEDPYFLCSAPPCTKFTTPQALSRGMRKDGEGHQLQVENDTKLLHFGIRQCRKRHEKKRWFLHERPWSASSWSDPDAAALASEPGVYVVRGDMCSWDLRAENENGEMEPVMKATGRLTNNGHLAELFSRRCNGKHKHTQLMGKSKVRGAKSYTMKLNKVILKVLKQGLVRIGEVNSVAQAGPIPDQEIEYWMPAAPCDGVAESGFWDDVNGGWLDSELVREARKLEMDWMKRQSVHSECDESECYKATGKGPINTGWVDANKGDSERVRYRPTSERSEKSAGLVFAGRPGGEAVWALAAPAAAAALDAPAPRAGAPRGRGSRAPTMEAAGGPEAGPSSPGPSSPGSGAAEAQGALAEGLGLSSWMASPAELQAAALAAAGEPVPAGDAGPGLSWKRWAGRRGGQEEYQLGDGLRGMFSGAATSTGPPPVADSVRGAKHTMANANSR
ncbi:unnamed protein product [Prorocentrum cordatum]|uniref:Integrase catalytic domain-containing protein n=1 Tax=Prorocentrum cordatum TaxID=2364126 RepID=A0ABN9Q0M3_9DINO|nr:unnamed protein product [Polarella glacialis]